MARKRKRTSQYKPSSKKTKLTGGNEAKTLHNDNDISNTESTTDTIVNQPTPSTSLNTLHKQIPLTSNSDQQLGFQHSPLPGTSTTDQQAGLSSKKPYIIQKIRERKVRKFHVEEVTFRAKFNDAMYGTELLSITEDLYNMFDDVMQIVNTEHPDNEDKARLNIRHSGLHHDVTVHCQAKHNITVSIIMQR